MQPGHRRSARLRENGGCDEASYNYANTNKPKKARLEPVDVNAVHPSPKISNILGLPGLPPELLYEIVSKSPPPLPFPIAPRLDNQPLLETPFAHSEQRLQRRKTLRALAQTCQSLRKFALPLAWEKIEVVSVSDLDNTELQEDQDIARLRKKNRKKWEKELATELISQLEIVTVRSPELGVYVKSLTTFVTTHSARSVLRELGRCLAVLPSLHSVQLLAMASNTFWPDDKQVNAAFPSTLTFPSIRRLALCSFAQPLLKCCPNLEVLTATLDPTRPYDKAKGREMVKDMTTHCAGLQEISGLPINWDRDITDTVTKCEKLNSIALNDFCPWEGFPSAATVSRLVHLPSLSHISVHLQQTSDEGDPSPEQQDILMQCVIAVTGAYNPWYDTAVHDFDAPKEVEDERRKRIFSTPKDQRCLSDDPIVAFRIGPWLAPWVWRYVCSLSRENSARLDRWLERKPLPTVTMYTSGNHFGVITGSRHRGTDSFKDLRSITAKLCEKSEDPFEDVTVLTPQVPYDKFAALCTSYVKGSLGDQSTASTS